MRSSFDAMHHETRPLHLLDEPAEPCPRPALLTAVLLLGPVIAALLLL